MLEKLSGTIHSIRAVTMFNAQFEFEGITRTIDLTLQSSWVLNHGDRVGVVGETDPKTGKFTAYAYKNYTREVHGKGPTPTIQGILFIIAAFAFCWAIFPVFVHLPLGIKMLRLASKVNEAEAMLNAK